MPPIGFRKRERSSSAAPSSAPKKNATSTKRAKPTLFETAETPKSKSKSLEENRKFLQDLDGDDDESSLSEADSDEFEDVPSAKRRKTAHAAHTAEDEDDDEDEEMDWENAVASDLSSHTTPSAPRPEAEIGDVSISMNDDGTYIQPLVSAATGKKGPSKRERQVRVQTHCLHVQALMWHNTIRNSWLNDKEVQKTLVDGLTEGVKREVQRWKKAMGAVKHEEDEAKQKATPAKGKGRKGKKGKEKSTGRDWNASADHLEPGVPNMSAGDPLLRLLKVLTAYWRKRFAVTATGLRKQGYKPLRRLRDEIKAWEKEYSDAEEHGERIASIDDFRKLAKECEGSRDVGAQLFVALLRGLGLETRMVANLQPAGFGWSKAEEADAKKDKKKAAKQEKVELESESDDEVVKVASSKSASSAKKSKKALNDEKPTRRSSRGNKSDPINLDDSDSVLSSPPFESEHEPAAEEQDDDDISIIDITPSTPRKKPTKKFDRDLAFPIYWTEVCSPITHKYYPVDPIVLSTIASNDELLQTFEPRGKKAEKSKQVICYAIAFASDGTAKDVTIRYLKRHQLPGKTKGMRMPVEKVPVYNRKGKVKKYEEYDWFRTLMSLYDRPESKRTTADDLEEQSDLKPFKPAKEEKEIAKESLQGYKQSADFVLEQHLRREEALLPGSEPVKTFVAGKGDKAVEHPVYRRDDVVVCKTVESWHKEGREIKIGEQPLKYVPVRAVTLIRKQEMEQTQRETGEKMKQGLYSQAQTDWIIPPPIKNGVIPKNAFGNMDVYVPTMVPKGAVHLPLKGSAKLCRKLEIDYAEACTGFEFGKQRAVPVLTGVVVANEHAGMVRDAWRAEQQEVKRKQDTKRTATALHWWRKMLLGLRVLERMRRDYADTGGKEEEVNPFVRRVWREGRGGQSDMPIDVDDDDGGNDEAGEEMGGGFLRPGMDMEEVARPDRRNHATSAAGGEYNEDGGFVVEDGDADSPAGGGSLVEQQDDDVRKPPPKNHAPITPVSLQSLHKGMDGAADSEEEGAQVREPPAKRLMSKIGAQTRPAQAKAGASKAKATENKRRVIVSSLEEDSEAESSLSDISDVESDVSENASKESESESTPPPSRKAKRASPKVVITPAKSVQRRVAKKSTPVRSQYFHHSDDEDDSMSEVEIVKPRKTTARTRMSG